MFNAKDELETIVQRKAFSVQVQNIVCVGIILFSTVICGTNLPNIELSQTVYKIACEQDSVIKAKVKLSRYHHAGAKVKRKYSSYSFLTSVLGKAECSA
jgi:hypothetical protein